MTSPWPQDRAIWPAGQYTVSSHGPGRDRTHRSTGACGSSQSERLQAGRPPLLLHSTGQWRQDRSLASGRRAIMQSAVTVPGRSSPRCCCTVPAAATGQGHRASGPLYNVRTPSGEFVHGRIGLTEALARAGLASQYA